MTNRTRVMLVLGVTLAFLPLSHADDGHPDGPHLRYQTTYADAMLEARIRNVPVFFSRHKDF